MNKTDVLRLALRHLESHPLAHPDYVWTLSDPVEFDAEWRFKYTFTCLSGIPEEEWESFGGAPGFAINKKTGVTRNLGWNEISGK